MNLKAKFNCKDNEIEAKMCAVEKIVELPDNEYEYFRCNLLEEYPFIKENTDCMYQSNEGVRHCLLVLGDDHDDGILVDAQGYGYARYTSYLPNARSLAMQMKYPSLTAYTNELCWLADKYVQKAVLGQLDCQYRIDFDEVRSFRRHDDFNEQLFMDMLSDRNEIHDVEFIDDGCTVTIADPYLRQEDEQNLRLLSCEEIEVKCAKHILWLHDAGGEQADFSNCLIKDMNLTGKNLINAVFDGAKFVNTKLSEAKFCYSLFNGVRFQNCNCQNITAEECEFKAAECIGCNFDRAILTHSNFADAKFYDCTMHNAHMQHCCFAQTDFGDTNLNSADIRNYICNEQKWADEQLGENISI